MYVWGASRAIAHFILGIISIKKKRSLCREEKKEHALYSCAAAAPKEILLFTQGVGAQEGFSFSTFLALFLSFSTRVNPIGLFST